MVWSNSSPPPIIILGTVRNGILITLFLSCVLIYEYFHKMSSRFLWMYMIYPCFGAMIALTFQIVRFCMWRRKALRMLEGVPHIVHHKDEIFKEYHWFWGDFGNYRFHPLDFPQFRMRCLVENDSTRPVARKTRPPIFHRCCNVQILDPRDVKYILKDNVENFVKSPDMIENFQDALGSGIFVTNHGKHAEDGGKRWYKQRKSSAKIFTRSNFKTFFLEQFANGSESLCEVLKKYSESKEILDIQRLMGNFTLDSIGHVAFGSDLGCLRREATTVEGKQPSASHRFAIAFDVAQHRAIERFVTPVRKFFPAFIRPYVVFDHIPQILTLYH